MTSAMESRQERCSISVPPLSLYQRLIYGVAAYGVGSASAVLEGFVIYHYNDEVGVSTKYLAVVNFIVGVTTIFASLIIGGISDRSKARYRRKPFIFFLMFIFAAGLFFRLGAFTSGAAGPVYYTVTMLLQMCGNVSLGVVQGAWAVELANEGADRANFFTICGVVGVIGVFIGLGLSALPLVIGGIFLAAATIISNVLCLLHVEEKTPLSKRSFVPTVTNLKSVFWNQQFNILIGALVFVYFINTVPALFLFFLKYAMGLSQDAAELTYLLCLATFVLMGFVAMPLCPRLIAKYGKITMGDAVLKSFAVLGILFFISSYIHAALIVVIFGFIGFVASTSGIVFSIMLADTVDYDELLTGAKRGASYGGVAGPVNTFITIAGSSIPLALMSVFKFEAPDPDADDMSDDRAQNGYSTDGSTGVLRVYCSLFISLCATLSFLILRMYKIDNEVHDKILASIHERNISASINNNDIDAFGDEFDASAGIDKDTGRSSIVEEEVPVIKSDINLSSVINPVTEKHVVPPPYITVQQTINMVLENKSIMAPAVKSLDDIQKNDLRLLGYYFPGMLNLCIDSTDINTILLNGFVRLLFFTLVTAAGVWQTVLALVDEKEFPTYLVVVTTTIYIAFLSWEILYVKGYKLLKRMKADPDRTLQGYLEIIYAQLDELQHPKAPETNSNEEMLLNKVDSGDALYTTTTSLLNKNSLVLMAVMSASLAFAVISVALS